MEGQELILTALQYYGLKEKPGTDHEHLIIDMFKAAGADWIQDDETAWCSAFLCWVARQCGYGHPCSVKARDWLSVGMPVTTPRLGDVAVYWRVSKQSGYGHVHLYVSTIGEYNYGLGGNQSNMVNIAPQRIERLLGYRRLRTI